MDRRENNLSMRIFLHEKAIRAKDAHSRKDEICCGRPRSARESGEPDPWLQGKTIAEFFSEFTFFSDG